MKLPQQCYQTLQTYVDLSRFNFLVEPSAGKGAFYRLLPPSQRIGMDLEPKCEGLLTQDYFQFKFDLSKKYLIIGNPPFGKNASLAIQFFNHWPIMPRSLRLLSHEVSNELVFKINSIFLFI